MTKFSITKITVLTSPYVTDTIFLHTDLPPAIPIYNEAVTFRFDATQGTGKGYCEQHFPGIPIEVIKTNGD